MSLLIEIQSFPGLVYFKKAILETNIKIEQYEFFQKMSFRNRYVIAGANGLTSLTIPVVGGREQKTPIKEVEIDYSANWPVKHWRTIASCYRRAPFFEHYESEIEGLLMSSEKCLFDLNYKILLVLFRLLNLDLTIELTTGFFENAKEDTDCRSSILPKNYRDLGNGKPTYSQVFEDRNGFQPNLSILDLLFCEGPNSSNLLINSVI